MPHGNALDIQIYENMLEKEHSELNFKYRTWSNIMNDRKYKFIDHIDIHMSRFVILDLIHFRNFYDNIVNIQISHLNKNSSYSSR